MQPQTEDQDTLSGLEERILKAVELVSQLRQRNETLQRQLAEAISARAEAEKTASEARAESARIAGEMDSLRSERKQVRTRIEKLLGQMDLLSEG
jgi:hypothetical protein